MDGWPIRVMIYGAGEAINGTNSLSSQIQAQLGRLGQISTNAFVAATAQLDSSSVPTVRYVLDPSGRQPMYQIANVDVGDPAELVNFVTWSAGTVPGSRTVLVLSGHGAAWQDSMVDQVLGNTPGATTRSLTAVATVPGAVHHARSLFGSNVTSEGSVTRAVLVDGQDHDYLSNAELGSACARISSMLKSKIDVLVFDACLMSSWEILQELSGSVSTVVGSIDELSAAGVDMAGPVAVLTGSKGIGDDNTIGLAIVNSFKPQADFDSCVAVSLANPAWASALVSFRAFCTAFLPWVQASQANLNAAQAALRLAATSVVEYSSGGLADVSSLAQSISGIANIPATVVANIQDAASSLASCVLGMSAGLDYKSALGISIFSPNSNTTYTSNRPDYIRLQFATLTGWGAVLDAIYGIDSVYSRFILAGAPKVPAPDPVNDAEFVVSLQGMNIDSQTQDRIEAAIRRAVVTALAQIDSLVDVKMSPMSTLVSAAARSVLPPQGHGRDYPLGLLVDRNLMI